MNLSRWLFVSLVAAGATAGTTAAGAAAPVRPPRPAVWSTAETGWTRVETGPIVNGGRVWVLDQRGTSAEFRLRSRSSSLRAQTERSWSAAIPESLRGVPGFTGGGSVYRSDAINDDLHVLFSGLAIDGSTAYVGSSWCTENSGPLDVATPARCAGTQIAAFPLSGGTGTIVSQPGERLVSGPPAVAFHAPAPSEGGGARLRALGTGETFAFPGLPNPETDVQTFQASGSRILEYRYQPGDAAHTRPPLGWSVFDYRTGIARYRVDHAILARTLARRPVTGFLDVALRPDGELATNLASSSANRTHGVRPAFIDATGARRFVGRRMPGAYGVRVTPAGPAGRNLVSVTGYTRRAGKRRYCDGTWITDRAGGRAVRLRPPSALEFVEDGGSYWNGATLVLTRLASRKTGLQDGQIAAWRGLDRVRLSSSDTPRCPRGR